MKTQLIHILSFYLVAQTPSAWATYNFGDERFRPLFEKTLIFGHSISSGLLNKAIFWADYGASPGEILAKTYSGHEPLENISEGWGTQETGYAKLDRMIHKDWETSQPHVLNPIESYHYSNRELQSLFDQATAIVGIDAFYMSVAFNDCRDFPTVRIRRTLDLFTQSLVKNEKIALLGNVPKEDWSQVQPLPKAVLTGSLSAGYSSEEAEEHFEKKENGRFGSVSRNQCRQIFNQALADYCRPDRNCYVVDLKQTVKTIHSDGKLKLSTGTTSSAHPDWGFLRNEIRPDGINLSEDGVQYVLDLIFNALEAQPPQMKVGLPHP